MWPAHHVDQINTNFSVSLPCFDFKHITGTIEAIEMKRKIESKSQLTDLGNITVEAFSLTHATFASLYYHRKFFLSNMNQENKQHESYFFKDAPQEILNYAIIKHPRSTTEHAPKLTGILPRVSTMAEFEELKHEFHQSS